MKSFLPSRIHLAKAESISSSNGRQGSGLANENLFHFSPFSSASLKIFVWESAKEPFILQTQKMGNFKNGYTICTTEFNKSYTYSNGEMIKFKKAKIKNVYWRFEHGTICFIKRDTNHSVNKITF